MGYSRDDSLSLRARIEVALPVSPIQHLLHRQASKPLLPLLESSFRLSLSGTNNVCCFWPEPAGEPSMAGVLADKSRTVTKVGSRLNAGHAAILVLHKRAVPRSDGGRAQWHRSEHSHLHRPCRDRYDIAVQPRHRWP